MKTVVEFYSNHHLETNDQDLAEITDGMFWFENGWKSDGIFICCNRRCHRCLRSTTVRAEQTSTGRLAPPHSGAPASDYNLARIIMMKMIETLH